MKIILQINLLLLGVTLIFNKTLNLMNHKSLNNPKSKIEVLKLIEMFNLKNICRKYNPNRLEKNSSKTSQTWYFSNLIIITDTLKICVQ